MILSHVGVCSSTWRRYFVLLCHTNPQVSSCNVIPAPKLSLSCSVEQVEIVESGLKLWNHYYYEIIHE